MGAKQFSKLDVSLGFWQIKFDKETSNLLAFGTTTGIFHLKWLPCGLHSACEVFRNTVSRQHSNLGKNPCIAG